MRNKAQQLLDKIDALSLRERALLLLAVIVVSYTAWDHLLMIPMEAERKQLEQRQATTQDRLVKLDSQIKVMQETLQKNDALEQKERIAQLSSEIERLDREIIELAGRLIPPQDMARVLEQMLTLDGRLTLMHVENLPPKPLIKQAPPQKPKQQTANKSNAEAQPTIAPAPAPAIYRHSVIIEFEGGFQETVDYIRTLEALPELFFWDRIEYSVDEFPKAKISITVSTLSFQKGWIGV